MQAKRVRGSNCVCKLAECAPTINNNTVIIPPHTRIGKGDGSVFFISNFSVEFLNLAGVFCAYLGPQLSCQIGWVNLISIYTISTGTRGRRRYTEEVENQNGSCRQRKRIAVQLLHNRDADRHDVAVEGTLKTAVCKWFYSYLPCMFTGKQNITGTPATDR